MSDQFQVRFLQELPARSWLFHLPKNANGHLYHGSSVEVYEDGFLEGCFAGGLSEDFSQLANVFGSGLKIRNEAHWFVTPSHTLECLFAYQSEDGVTVSNSLAFLIEFNRLSVPWAYAYGRQFSSIVLGIEDYEKRVISTPCGPVLRYAYDNIRVDRNCCITAVRKPLVESFSNYTGYVDFLRGVLYSAFSNAKAADRKVTCEPLATCSSGYDSSACAALVRGLGCTEALTLRRARGGEVDSGLQVAQELDMEVTELDRPEFAPGPFSDLACFFSTGMGGEDYCYREFRPFLRRRILLTGFHGDKIWGLSKPNAVLMRGDISGCSLQEFRLQADFTHIPVPMIGALRHQDVLAISRSKEMEAYRVHTNYDRPIPRRILEESGVSRELFGQSKKAASILLFSEPETISSDLRREIADRVYHLRPHLAQQLSYRVAALLWKVRAVLYRGLCRIAWRLPIAKRLAACIVDDWRTFEHSHPQGTVTFLSGLEIMRESYHIDSRPDHYTQHGD